MLDGNSVLKRVIRGRAVPIKAGGRLCLSVWLACLVLLGPTLAAGHGHDHLEVGDDNCVVCHLQQTKCYQALGAPTLVPEPLQALRNATEADRPTSGRPYLLSPVRGPPRRA